MRKYLPYTSFLIGCILSTLLFPLTSKAQKITQPQKKDSSVLTQRQKDRLFLKRAGTDRINTFKKRFAKTWDKVFVDFTNNDVFLMAGMNFTKQNISANDYNAPFVYAVEQRDVYKPGFMGGFRVDGKFKEKHPYAVAFTLNKYATGTNYKETKTLEPFIGGFSSFKAAEQLFSLNMTALYKKIIPITDTAKYKFYVVTGPSLDIRLSGQSLDNQVNNNYRKMFLRAQFGLEFDNKSYYTIFFHYKQGLHSVTKSPIQTGFNSFDLGMLIKASDLF
jgi:hypothetical protein